jgi:hypothetical protein
MRMNRLQNEKLIYGEPGGPQVVPVSPTPIYKETSRTYMEVTDDLHFLSDGSGFVLTSERDGWNHIYWNAPTNGEARQLTPGSGMCWREGRRRAEQAQVIFTAARIHPSNRRC